MIKYALIKHLKADSGVSGLVGNRITPRRLAAQSAYPAIVVHKISEFNSFAHSGSTSIFNTRIQLDCISKRDFEMEDVKAAIISSTHLFQGIMDNVTVLLCYIDDDADQFDDDVAEENEFLGTLDLIIIWRIT